MTSINLSININTPTFPKLYRVRKYNDPVMLAMGYDINLISPNILSNFAYVQVWIPGLGTGSISTYCIIPPDDVANLRQLQYAQEGVTVDQKMAWLLEGEVTGSPSRPMWIKNGQVRWGCMVFANQLVLVDKIETMLVKVPNSPNDAFMQMGRLVTFGRADWGKTFDTHPYLIEHATAVRGEDNIHNETPRGEIFSPLWSPVDFDVHPIPTNSEFKREFWAYMDTLIQI